MLTERDLEEKYHKDTGNYATDGNRVTGSYTRGFYDWCVENLLLEYNKKLTDENKREIKEFKLE